MTTIAYKNGIMAADSMCTAESTFIGHAPKLYRLKNKAVLGAAGDMDARAVMALLEKATAYTMPARKALAETETDFSGIMAFPNGRVFHIAVYQGEGDKASQWIGQAYELDSPFFAIGTGESFALGAMKAGRSAEEAVKIACYFDSYSAPPIQTEKVK